MSDELEPVVDAEIVDENALYDIARNRRDAIIALLDDAENLILEAIPLIKKAYAEKDWLAMDHDTWEEYVEREVPVLQRLALDKPTRLRVHRELSDAGMSSRAIVATTGASKGTVHRDTAGAPNGAGDKAIQGRDGKTYTPPAPRPKAPEPRMPPGLREKEERLLSLVLGMRIPFTLDEIHTLQTIVDAIVDTLEAEQ